MAAQTKQKSHLLPPTWESVFLFTYFCLDSHTQPQSFLEMALAHFLTVHQWGSIAFLGLCVPICTKGWRAVLWEAFWLLAWELPI